MPADIEVTLRITAIAPPAGVLYSLQRGQDEIVSPVRSDGTNISFDVPVRARDDCEAGIPNFLGPFVSGPKGARFVYLRIGQSAGDLGSPWSRRVKIPLGGITWELVRESARTSRPICAGYVGSAKDGSPACATVPLTQTWTVAGE